MELFFYNKIGSIISIGDLPTINIIEPIILISAFFLCLIAFVLKIIIEIYRNFCYSSIIKLKEIIMFKEIGV